MKLTEFYYKKRIENYKTVRDKIQAEFESGNISAERHKTLEKRIWRAVHKINDLNKKIEMSERMSQNNSRFRRRYGVLPWYVLPGVSIAGSLCVIVPYLLFSTPKNPKQIDSPQPIEIRDVDNDGNSGYKDSTSYPYGEEQTRK